MFGDVRHHTAIAVAVVLLAAPVAAHCSTTAPVDSATVAGFLDLPLDEIEARRAQADDLAHTAGKSNEGPTRRSAWEEITALVPSSTEYWLARVETELEMGYIEEAQASLAAARVTIEFLEGQDRREAIRDYALWVAWWDYEMGRFDKGLAWGRRALEYGAGLPGHLITGLNFAKSAETWDEVRAAGAAFKPLASGGNRRANFSWCLISFAQKNNWPPYHAEEAAWWLHRSKGFYEHDLTRWRDYGQYCEMNGSSDLATAYYERGIESLPIREGGWITRIEFSAPSTQSPNTAMPIWINEDLGFVTGSLLAYAAFAHQRMTLENSASKRVRWAERVSVATLRCVERYPSSPWLYLWHAEALVLLSQPVEAEEAVRRARAGFRKAHYDEPEMDRVEGHVLVAAGKYAQASDPLRRAVVSYPSDAGCWTDLGIVKLRAGNDAAAREHFDQAIKIDSSHPAALYQRGLLRWRQGDLTGALVDIESASLASPGDAQIAEMLNQLREVMTDGERR